MEMNTWKQTRNFIVEDDNSLLMFENEEIIIVRKFKEKITGELTGYIDSNTSFGRLKHSDHYSAFGQINKLEWVYYPSEGRDCKLLILGEKDWREGKIKIYGQCTFLAVLELLSKDLYARKDHEKHSQLLQELRNQGIQDFKETRQIVVTLEFIPANTELDIPQEPESPLDDIRRSMM